MLDYDAELRYHNDVFRAACGIRETERVLDIGCGRGQTTRDAARIATSGAVVGVDKSPEMIDAAEAVRRADGTANIVYECADVERHDFARGAFDVAISRFGTMFFADPVAAFKNVRGALRADGRLVMMVWQTRERNAWALSIAQALAGSAAQAGAPQPAFSLGEPDVVTRLLAAAGFGEPTFDDVTRPVCYGPDVDAALAFVLQFSTVAETLDVLSDSERENALARLRRMLEAHRTDADGVCLGSRAWIVTALCR